MSDVKDITRQRQVMNLIFELQKRYLKNERSE